MNCEICGTKVTSWSANYAGNVTHCKKCFGSNEAKEYIKNKALEPISIEAPLGQAQVQDEVSYIGMLCFLIAGLSLLSGVILCGLTWPVKNTYSQELDAMAYTSSFIWLFAGLTQFTLFSALGQIHGYLKRIVKSDPET